MLAMTVLKVIALHLYRCEALLGIIYMTLRFGLCLGTTTAHYTDKRI